MSSRARSQAEEGSTDGKEESPRESDSLEEIVKESLDFYLESLEYQESMNRIEEFR